MDKLQNSLNYFLQQLNENEQGLSSSKDKALPEHHAAENELVLNKNHLLDIVHVLQQKVTALTLILNENPSKSTALDNTAKEIEDYAQLLTTFVTDIPKTIGRSLKRHVVYISQDLIKSILGLVDLYFVGDGGDFKAKVGIIWEHCKAFESMETKNTVYVGSIITDVIEMLNDGASEMQDLMDGVGFGDEEPVVLNNIEKEWMNQCQILIKTNILCLKRSISLLNEVPSTEYWIESAELLYSIANQSCAKSDDMVSCMDIPLDLEDEFLRESVSDLNNCCLEILKLIRKMERDNDKSQKWSDLCERKLTDLTEAMNNL
ncbi:hypothetical protein BC833DRAFT_574909 [Globomyces pollinis-pini]|nr:hypothetical protein BC833DRAFT_574909 [Globomyces pollinis-pini]